MDHRQAVHLRRRRPDRRDLRPSRATSSSGRAGEETAAILQADRGRAVSHRARRRDRHALRHPRDRARWRRDLGGAEREPHLAAERRLRASRVREFLARQERAHQDDRASPRQRGQALRVRACRQRLPVRLQEDRARRRIQGGAHALHRRTSSRRRPPHLRPGGEGHGAATHHAPVEERGHASTDRARLGALRRARDPAPRDVRRPDRLRQAGAHRARRARARQRPLEVAASHGRVAAHRHRRAVGSRARQDQGDRSPTPPQPRRPASGPGRGGEGARAVPALRVPGLRRSVHGARPRDLRRAPGRHEARALGLVGLCLPRLARRPRRLRGPGGRPDGRDGRRRHQQPTSHVQHRVVRGAPSSGRRRRRGAGAASRRARAPAGRDPEARRRRGSTGEGHRPHRRGRRSGGRVEGHPAGSQGRRVPRRVP
jgi:hypothetical protein